MKFNLLVIPTFDGRANVWLVKPEGDKEILGTMGGEPEDNCYYRDWSWVPSALERVAELCGAEMDTLVMNE